MLIFFCIISLFDPFEWIEYRDYRYVQSIDVDTRWIWVASTDGIIRYDKLRENWEIPRTRTTFPDNIRVIGVDEFSNYIWFVTTSILARYNNTFKDIDEYPLPIQGKPAHIAFTKDAVLIDIGNRYCRFDRETQEFKLTDSENVEWKPKNQPQDFELLSPYFVQDRHLRIYYMTCVVSDGRSLWVGTGGKGLYRYDIYTCNSENLCFGVPGGKIRAIHPDGAKIWIGGDNDAITLWEREKNRWNYFDLSEYGLSSTRVRAIATDCSSVWFATPEGLVRLHDDEFKTFTVFDGLPSNNVTDVETDSNAVWVATDWGLARVIQDVIVKEDKTEGVRINDIALVGDSLFIATPYGVWIKYGKELYALPDSTGIFSTGVSVVCGNKFFATKMGIVTNDGKRLTYPVDLPDLNIYTIEVSQDEVWIGTARGAVRFDKTLSAREIFNGENSPIKGTVYAISICGSSVLFGTDNGLIEYKRI
jgi:ligand-binding sensor domain-containing protein